MSRGPQINNTKKSFTIINNLGINGVSSTIAGKLCPIITNVTPRVFYWSFLIWIYYDFRNTNFNEKNYRSFYKHLRRQDYYFILSNLLTPEADKENIVGKEKILESISKNTSGMFFFKDDYYQAKNGGMRNYVSGLFTMGLLNNVDQETGEEYSFPHVTKKGQQIAKAFENVIKETNYYKEYRLSENPVPKEILLQFAQKINIGLKGFNEVKALMKNIMFEIPETSFEALVESAAYIKFINKEYKISKLSNNECREIFFDYFSKKGNNNNQYPSNLQNIIDQWEIYVGRQYFTMGLEIIWKYILECLNFPKDEKTWIIESIASSSFNFNLDDKLENIIDDCVFDYDKREQMIKTCGKGTSNDIQYGLQLILSIYNRFNKRTEYSDETSNYLNEGFNNKSIPLSELLVKVDNFKNKTIKDFLENIMLNWLIRQHEATAFSKLLDGRNGYYIEKVDGEYYRKSFGGFFFQDIRMVQLMHVMKDLDMLEVN